MASHKNLIDKYAASGLTQTYNCTSKTSIFLQRDSGKPKITTGNVYLCLWFKHIVLVKMYLKK
jgi:hypothetical protein